MMESVWGSYRGDDLFSARVDLYRFLASAAQQGGPVRLLPVMVSRCSLERPLAAAGWLPTRYDVRLF